MAGAGRAAALRALRRGRRRWSSVRRRAGRALPGPRRCTAWWATSSATSAASPTASGGCSPSSAGRSATSTRPSAPRFLAALRELMGPTDRLLIGTDLVKDRAVLEAAYNDSAGRDRRVQPQRAARAQPRAGRRLRPGGLRARGVLRRGQLVDRDAAARERRPDACGSTAPTWRSSSPTARRCAPRSAPSSRRDAVERELDGAGHAARRLPHRRRRACSGWRRPSRRIALRAGMDLNGTGAFISGGASGLGEATARALVERGARVAHRRRERREGRGAGRRARRRGRRRATAT